MLPKGFYYKTNRLQQLRGFYYTAQFNNVSKAAKFMNISQSTVSMQIKSLEEDLKIKLFNHNGPQISLTNLGQKLYLEATEYVEGINDLFSNFHNTIKNTEACQLNIAANQATNLYLLPKAIKEHLSKHQDINIKIHNSLPKDGIEIMNQGVVDIIIGPNSFDIPFDYEYTPLFFYRPVLITPKNHHLAGKKKITMKEIEKEQIILPPQSLRTIKTIDHLFAQHNFNNQVRLEFNNWEIVKKFTQIGIGITISAEICIEDNDELVGTLIDHLLPSISYGYILKRNAPIPQKVQDFITTIKSIPQISSKNVLG